NNDDMYIVELSCGVYENYKQSDSEDNKDYSIQYEDVQDEN
ncbi:14448_t:CDS:1, partial [Racocetra persica]